jgi:hypothetical protein
MDEILEYPHYDFNHPPKRLFMYYIVLANKSQCNLAEETGNGQNFFYNIVCLAYNRIIIGS